MGNSPRSTSNKGQNSSQNNLSLQPEQGTTARAPPLPLQRQVSSHWLLSRAEEIKTQAKALAQDHLADRRLSEENSHPGVLALSPTSFYSLPLPP